MLVVAGEDEVGGAVARPGSCRRRAACGRPRRRNRRPASRSAARLGPRRYRSWTAKVMSPVVASDRRLLGGQAVEADLHALDLDDLLVDRVGRLAAVGFADVGGDDREFRLRRCGRGKCPGRSRTRGCPGVIMSTPIWFRMSIWCAPLSMPESSDGEIVSPEWTKKRRALGALALRRTAASLAKPPRPSCSSMRSMSLVCTKRSVDASRRRRGKAHRRVSAARGPATGRGGAPDGACSIMSCFSLEVKAVQDGTPAARFCGEARASGADMFDAWNQQYGEPRGLPTLGHVPCNRRARGGVAPSVANSEFLAAPRDRTEALKMAPECSAERRLRATSEPTSRAGGRLDVTWHQASS